MAGWLFIGRSDGTREVTDIGCIDFVPSMQRFCRFDGNTWQPLCLSDPIYDRYPILRASIQNIEATAHPTSDFSDASDTSDVR